MDVDSSSSSPSERLSVVCSASAEYSSNSSEYSPNSRRNSMNESVVKDEQYWERRRKNNDASKRSREKRRISDMAMEQRILALSQENHLLKSRLESRTAAESLLQTARPDFASLPSQSNTTLFTHQLPASSVGLQSLAAPPLSSLHSSVPSLSLSQVPLLSSTSQIPIMQLCQLQAALQQQVRRRHRAENRHMRREKPVRYSAVAAVRNHRPWMAKLRSYGLHKSSNAAADGAKAAVYGISYSMPFSS
ncbi:hypothetical protein RB195_017674 [Necator americanus]|uniref:BZIP domain-containing protein n=1 Tax=Necator americanus TaxID=51031 RepID=A0ABR1C689_NECAM